MRKLFLACLTLGAALVGNAQASVTVSNPLGLFEPGGVTQFKLTDYENVLNPNGTVNHGQIAVGDTFQGMFNITNSQNPDGSNPISPDSTFQLSGVFQTQVTAITNLGGGQFGFQLQPVASFATQFGLPAGAMIAAWDVSGNPFKATASSYQNAELTAVGTPSQLWAVGGAPAGGVWGTNYYWASVGSLTPSVASFSSSLALLYNNTGVNGLLGQTQNEPTGYGVPSLNNIINVIALQGNTNAQTNNSIPFEIISQDPLQLAVPEPTSVLVMGGLFAIAAMFAYRRKVKA